MQSSNAESSPSGDGTPSRATASSSRGNDPRQDGVSAGQVSTEMPLESLQKNLQGNETPSQAPVITNRQLVAQRSATIPSFKERLRQRMATIKAAQDEAAQNGKRARDDGLEDDEGPNKDRDRRIDHTMEINTPNIDISEVEPTKIRPFTRRCALKVAGAPYVGSTNVSLGWNASIKIDGRLRVDPVVSITLRCNNRPNSTNQRVNDIHSDAQIFRFRPPCVQCDKKKSHQMRYYEIFNYASSPENHEVFPPKMFEGISIKEKDRIQAFRIIWTGSTPNTSESPFNVEVWNWTGQEVLTTLEMLRQKQGMVTAYINWEFSSIEQINLKAFETSFRRCAEPLHPTSAHLETLQGQFRRPLLSGEKKILPHPGSGHT